MSYVVSVGGDPINPNPFNYSQISMTGNIALVWPNNNQDATYTATNWIDITASAAYAATMPPANEVGDGTESVFYNYGSYTITINDAIGGGITTVASGETKRIWITDNSTEAGTWRIANIGSGTTEADAAMLAGYGLVAQAGQLSQSMPPATYGTDATLNAGVRSYLAIWTGGSGTFTLANPATLGSNWFVNVKNAGSGNLNIDGNGADIDNATDIDISPNEGFTIETDGVKFYTVGRLTPETSTVTQLSKAVGGSADVTLTSAESAYSIINFTGVLTGNINVIVPNNVNEWLMFNNTSGAYTLTVKTAAGTGVAITQSTRRLLYSDGTNVHFSDSVGTGTVTSIATGTGLSGGPITTSGTISLANTAVTGGTYGDSSHFPIVTFNAQGQATASSQSASVLLAANNLSDVADATISLSNIFPAGFVIPYAGTAAPSGWLLCYGQAISRVDYAALFLAIGTTYGSGDGMTTFNVPDARGYAVAGKDNMGGSAANRITNAVCGITGTTLGATGGNQNMQSHTHTASVTDPGHIHAIVYGGDGAATGTLQRTTNNFGTVNTASATTGITVSNSTTGSGSSQNVQPTLILNYCIKT